MSQNPCLGIESGSDTILKNIEKGMTTDDIREVARLCREAGLDIYAMLLIGSPGETEETINESVELIREIDPFYAQFSFVVSAPNTPAFRYYKENGSYYLDKIFSGKTGAAVDGPRLRVISYSRLNRASSSGVG